MTTNVDTLSTAPIAEASPSTRLASRVARLRTRAAAGQYDRWLLIIGGFLLPLGVLVIILGWVGASHTPYLFQQNDYLISGGVLGLGLVVAGGFVYFAYWLTLMVRESRSRDRELVSALGRIESLLAGGSAAVPAAAGELVATATGTMLHRPDCPIVAGRDNLRRVRAGTPGFEPCKICQPLS
jgi:hypothetical protein